MAILEYYSLFTAQPYVANPTAFGPTIPISQTITGASSFVSTNDIDSKASPFRDWFAGPRPIYVVCMVTTAFTGTGSGAVTVTLQQSASAGAGTYTAIDILGSFPALSVPATNPVGAQTSVLIDNVQPNVLTQRYISVAFTIGGNVLTGGAVCAFLTPDPSVLANYGVGYSVATS